MIYGLVANPLTHSCINRFKRTSRILSFLTHASRCLGKGACVVFRQERSAVQGGEGARPLQHVFHGEPAADCRCLPNPHHKCAWGHSEDRAIPRLGHRDNLIAGACRCGNLNSFRGVDPQDTSPSSCRERRCILPGCRTPTGPPHRAVSGNWAFDSWGDGTAWGDGTGATLVQGSDRAIRITFPFDSGGQSTAHATAAKGERRPQR